MKPAAGKAGGQTQVAQVPKPCSLLSHNRQPRRLGPAEPFAGQRPSFPPPHPGPSSIQGSRLKMLLAQVGLQLLHYYSYAVMLLTMPACQPEKLLSPLRAAQRSSPRKLS